MHNGDEVSAAPHDVRARESSAATSGAPWNMRFESFSWSMVAFMGMMSVCKSPAGGVCVCLRVLLRRC